MKNKQSFFIVCYCMMGFFLQAQTFKIMTYNIRLDVASDGENDWSHRKDFFTAQIQFYAPDVFGIQEALPNQVLDIAAALPNYGYLGKGREENSKGEASNIFYNKEKFKVVDTNTFWLSQTPEIPSKGWDAACNRVCTYALLQSKQSDNFMWIFNTHLDHIGEVARTKGLALILSKIEELNSKKHPVILMGDFNSEPETERIIALKNKMDDARTLSKQKPFGPYGTFTNFKHNEVTNLLIDYIFISKQSNITINKYGVLSDSKELRYPSDHFPVFIEMEFK